MTPLPSGPEDPSAGPNAPADAHRPRGVARTTVEVAATPERVFRALTDPAELADWWGGTDADVHHVQTDPRPGGRWDVRSTDADGRETAVGGEYRVVDPPRTLETTWEPGTGEAPSTVRYELAPAEVGGAPGTRVTVTHTQACAARAGATSSRAAWPRRATPAWAVRRRSPA